MAPAPGEQQGSLQAPPPPRPRGRRKAWAGEEVEAEEGAVQPLQPVHQVAKRKERAGVHLHLLLVREVVVEVEEEEAAGVEERSLGE